MGMIDTLLKIEKSKSLPLEYKTHVWEVISLMCSHSKVAKKLLTKDHEVYKDIKVKLATFADKGALEGEYLNIAKFVLDTAG